MTRIIQALLIPADPDKDIVKVSGTQMELMELAGFEFFAACRGYFARQFDFVVCIDDVGGRRNLPGNRRAQFIAGYPDTLAGDALVFSEAFIEDGLDIVDLKPGAMDWITADTTKRAYTNWAMAGFFPLVPEAARRLITN